MPDLPSHPSAETPGPDRRYEEFLEDVRHVAVEFDPQVEDHQ